MSSNVSDVPRLELLRYRRIVVLTGAGISVASGLPTYRGVGGIWKQVAVDQHATAAAMLADPVRVWDFFSELRGQVGAKVPNAAHHALADAERRLGPEQTLTRAHPERGRPAPIGGLDARGRAAWHAPSQSLHPLRFRAFG